MDYIMYKRGDEKRYNEEYSFVFTCKHCNSRIWGMWFIPYIIHCNHRLLSGPDLARKSREFARKCFEEDVGREWVEAELKRCSSESWGEITPTVLAAYDIIASYRKEALQFCNMDKCPICGGKLTWKDLRFWGVYAPWGIKQHNDFSRKVGDRTLWRYSDLIAYNKECQQVKSKKTGDEKYRNFRDKCLSTDVPVQKYAIKETDQLKQFLSNIVYVEKNIYTVSERLKYLYRQENINEENAKDSLLAHRMEKKSKVDSLYANLTEAKARDIAKEVKTPQYKGKLPTKPIKPVAPSAPVLAKPGLFNKKRIITQNAALIEQFNKENAQYKADEATYNKELAFYESKLQEIQSKQEERRLKLLEQAQAAHAEECKQLEESYLAAKEEYEKIDITAVMTAEIIQFNAETEEIAQAEALLKKLFQVRKQMYESGVIFEKYHNFVAVSSFYEYLSSGRCSSLEGVDGAYNLYENEIRINAVVAHLADVVKNLKKIQANQFTIYSAITQATDELKELKHSAEAMNKSLMTMKKDITNISKNSDVIAYNSKITAYYTKKNAELTDALGYLIALK